ncbi:hypothetical protein [Streptomyces sp. PpalLS-921]|uniref:hypothetical protein n=1 Tax=Streptomyces sp. PpalLS-921 TaxID=1839772 RepID=UPI00081F0CD5|nr:hypothetical protein [Streptomyces sp. PpalLS-921]SCD61581.1 hypothetical protein GA0115249_106342 [Streptomyces sp. PpalLS-921]
MSTDAPYAPLHDPQTDRAGLALPLDFLLARTRETLAEHATANIHDRGEMLRAAVHLDMRLRQLVAALDKEANR